MWYIHTSGFQNAYLWVCSHLHTDKQADTFLILINKPFFHLYNVLVLPPVALIHHYHHLWLLELILSIKEYYVNASLISAHAYFVSGTKHILFTKIWDFTIICCLTEHIQTLVHPQTKKISIIETTFFTCLEPNYIPSVDYLLNKKILTSFLWTSLLSSLS